MTTDLTVDTPNLDALLAEYGMTRQEGLVIENDSSYYAYRYPQTYLLPSLSSNDITAGITDGMHVFTPVAQGIVKGDSTDDLTLTTLLSTSSTLTPCRITPRHPPLSRAQMTPTAPLTLPLPPATAPLVQR